MGPLRNIAWTFVIGFVAGVAPFIAIGILPGIMNQQTHLPPIGYEMIAILGALIGAVTAILYSNNFGTTPTKEIFFTALGIPALLIATVSNLTTKYDASKLVEKAAVVSEEPVTIETPAAPLIEEATPPGEPVSFFEGFLPRAALAQVPQVGVAALVKGTARYVVALGSHGTAEEAGKAVERWRRTRLSVEQFVAKDIRIFRAGKGLYYVTYTGALPREEAIRIYRLIKISDSKLTPMVVSLG